jgi:hypothetical protein
MVDARMGRYISISTLQVPLAADPYYLLRETYLSWIDQEER